MNFFRFKKTFFFFLILLLALFWLKNLNQNETQDPLTKSSHFLFSEIQTATWNFHKSLANTLKKYLFLISLREQNALLKEENQKLKSKYQIFEEVLRENKRLKRLKDFSSNSPYRLLPAQITSTDFLSTNEILNINKGSVHGVKKFMGVLHPQGVVGHIFRVSPNSSQVLTLISPLSSLPARNQNSRIQGLVEAHQKNQLIFHHLEVSEYLKKSDSNLKLGDKIVVRQTEAFPAGFLIGQIQLLDISSQSLNPKAYLQPAVSFQAVEEVLVILNLNQSKKKLSPHTTKEQSLSQSTEGKTNSLTADRKSDFQTTTGKPNLQTTEKKSSPQKEIESPPHKTPEENPTHKE